MVDEAVVTPQPVKALPALQFAEAVVVPAAELAFETVQPGAVCRVIELVAWLLTPSIMSISPEAGQLGPNIQKAGQTPQPVGMCEMSAMKSPWPARFWLDGCQMFVTETLTKCGVAG